MKVFTPDSFNYPVRVWVNGQDITNVATRIYANPKPGETAYGWAEVVVLDKDGKQTKHPTEGVMRRVVWGMVRWRPD